MNTIHQSLHSFGNTLQVPAYWVWRQAGDADSTLKKTLIVAALIFLSPFTLLGHLLTSLTASASDPQTGEQPMALDEGHVSKATESDPQTGEQPMALDKGHVSKATEADKAHFKQQDIAHNAAGSAAVMIFKRKRNTS